MSPHAKLRERGIFLADLDHERSQRTPGEPPTLRKSLTLVPEAGPSRHPIVGARQWPRTAHG